MSLTPSRSRLTTQLLVILTATLTFWPAGGVPGDARTTAALGPAAVDEPAVPPVLTGATWLAHHRDDLMPYWDMPEALGEPLGNFPSFRGRSGELLPEQTNRGTSTLARGVYGYSLAFLLTGQERYLTYARAGLTWIEAKAADPVHGGYFNRLRLNGEPINAQARKDVFDLASVGMAYAMYFNVTRDPAAEAHLLEIRDLLFDKYYDGATSRVKDALRFDLTTEVDTRDAAGPDGGDITDLLVPGTGMFLTTTDILTAPERRAQFRDDLRRLTEILISRHKNSADEPGNRWMFWGRTARFGRFDAGETDFGHVIKSYAMIHNANQKFADRPWDGLAEDRTTMLDLAWDDEAARWNQEPTSFAPVEVRRDSAWWMHDEADQLLAALDLTDDFAHRDRLARSAQSFLDVYVDRDPAFPVRETFRRVSRTPGETSLEKSFFGKNMLHNPEHALIMYLHGTAMEREPARLHYAFPADLALTAVAKPYWFDASGETRTDLGPLGVLPGHHHVQVDMTGIGQVLPEPFPAPADTTAPSSAVAVSPPANTAGWHRDEVTVSLTAVDATAGVKEIHASVVDATGASRDVAYIGPGAGLALPAIAADGDFTVRWFAVDNVGNHEQPQTLRVRVDRTAPALAGLPEEPCTIWPPTGQMVHVADVSGTDAASGVAALDVAASSDEADPDDISIVAGAVDLRARRDGPGDDREYHLTATLTDVAGNLTTDSVTCVVPHDLARPPAS